MIAAVLALVEIEDEDVWNGMTPSLAPDCKRFATDVLCRRAIPPGEDCDGEDCASRADVDDDVVIVIKVLDVAGVDEVLLEGETVSNGITPTERTFDGV